MLLDSRRLRLWAMTEPFSQQPCFHGKGPGCAECAALDLLLRESPGSIEARNRFMGAVGASRLYWVRRALELGVDPNASGEYGILSAMKPPLHAARSAEVMSVLVEAGASVDARDGGGFSALHEAVLRGDVEVIFALIKCGADINSKTGHGNTSLDLIETVSWVPPFRKRRVRLALLRAGALVDEVRQRSVRKSLRKYTFFDQFAANRRRVWVSVITKCAAIPHDAAGVCASFVSPKGGY